MKAIICLLFLISSVSVHAQTARQSPPMRSGDIGTTSSIHQAIPIKSSGPSAQKGTMPLKTGGATSTNSNTGAVQKPLVPLKTGGAGAAAPPANGNNTATAQTVVPIRTADSKAPATTNKQSPATISKTGSVVTPSALSAKDAAELNKQASQLKAPSTP